MTKEGTLKKPELKACECNIAHALLYSFDDAVAKRTGIDGTMATKALRHLLFTGVSDFIERAKERLHRKKESTSCPRFLYRAWESIHQAQERSSQIDNYWGAYYTVSIELYLRADTDTIVLPERLTRLRLQDRELDTLTGKDRIEILHSITSGLEEIVKTRANDHERWAKVRKTLGGDIVENISVCLRQVMKVPNWYHDDKARNSAINLVSIWCGLWRVYSYKLRVTKEPMPDYELEGILQAFRIDVEGYAEEIRKIVEVLEKTDGNFDEKFTAVTEDFWDSYAEFNEIKDSLTSTENSPDGQVKRRPIT